MSSQPPIIEERPYRSHLQPACLPCRNRKSRCRSEATNPALCLMCKAHGTRCVYPEPTQEAGTVNRATRKALARRKQTPAVKSPNRTAAAQSSEPRHIPGFPVEEARATTEIPFSSVSEAAPVGGDDSHVVGPVQSPEAQLIANYLQNDPRLDAHRRGMHISREVQFVAGKRPVLFNAIRKHPLGYVDNQSIASQKCEVVENLVDPFCDQLIATYFDKVHRSFPLLDEASFMAQYTAEKKKISPALLCCIYAQSLTYWQNGEGSGFRRPNLRYIWNQATEALYSELHLSPGISTVIAILLNISGRPLSAMIGNAVLLGSAISLAHSLGLNRNCLDWNISPLEKNLRMRLWWAIIIYDKWSSASYGTPPQLRTAQHDVPVSSVDGIFGLDRQNHDYKSPAVFIGLVTLTEILDQYLNHVFDIQQTGAVYHAAVSLGMETQLAQWENSLPQDLRRCIIHGVDLKADGTANLRLTYLYVRLLGRKLSIDSEDQNQATDAAILNQRYILARQSAESIVLFVQELEDEALGDFWLSFNAFALSTTVAFLLRSALETETHPNGLAQSIFVKLASDMITALQSHRDRMGWDLANICIAQYAEIVENLMIPSAQTAESMPVLQQFLMTETVGVDDMFPSIWDIFNDSH